MKKTRTRIFLERRKVTVVRSPRQEREAFCIACSKEVRMVLPLVAATQAGVSASAIYREVGRHTIHFTTTAEGLLLICSESLRDVFEK